MAPVPSGLLPSRLIPLLSTSVGFCSDKIPKRQLLAFWCCRTLSKLKSNDSKIDSIYFHSLARIDHFNMNLLRFQHMDFECWIMRGFRFQSIIIYKYWMSVDNYGKTAYNLVAGCWYPCVVALRYSCCLSLKESWDHRSLNQSNSLKYVYWGKHWSGLKDPFIDWSLIRDLIQEIAQKVWKEEWERVRCPKPWKGDWSSIWIAYKHQKTSDFCRTWNL